MAPLRAPAALTPPSAGRGGAGPPSADPGGRGGAAPTLVFVRRRQRCFGEEANGGLPGRGGGRERGVAGVWALAVTPGV